MRRLSLLVLAAAALIAGLIFLIWPRSPTEAEAKAEAAGPLEAEEDAPPAEPERAAVPPPPAAADLVAGRPATVGAEANASGSLARRQMEGIRDGMRRLTPHELSIYVRFQQMGVAPPPETKTLIERRKAGATAAELEAYVREAFPRDARVRLVATQWIRAAPPAVAAPSRQAVPSPEAIP